MQSMLKYKLFWLISAIAAIAIFLIALNSGRTYRAQTDILFIPKSEMAASNISQILSNARQIPRSLSFYDTLLELHPDIDDQTVGFDDASRRAFWNKKISLKSIDGSGVVRVLAEDQSLMQAEIISKQTADDIIVVIGNYYDTRNDLNMHIIDGPVICNANAANLWLWAILSLLLGLAAGMIAYLISGLIKDASLKTRPAIMNFKRPGLYSFLDKKAEARRPEAAQKRLFNLGLSSKEAKHVFAPQKKSAAPENLPVGSEFVMNALKRTQAEQEEKIEEAVMAKKTHEATPEEVKARLNKLLGGGL